MGEGELVGWLGFFFQNIFKIQGYLISFCKWYEKMRICQFLQN